MLIRWGDIDNAFAMLDQVRRAMGRASDDVETAYGTTDPVRSLIRQEEWAGAWPRMTLKDEGSKLVLTAEIPGLSQEDVKVMVNQDVLTIAGERKAEVPAGYSVHRHERPSVKFSRSLTLGTKIDLEKATASMKNGVLNVTLLKAPESQPKQISIQAH